MTNERQVQLFACYDPELEDLGYEGKADLYGDGTIVDFNWSPKFGLTSIDPMTFRAIGWEDLFLETKCRELYNSNLIGDQYEKEEYSVVGY